jgi:hypothetical protein
LPPGQALFSEFCHWAIARHPDFQLLNRMGNGNGNGTGKGGTTTGAYTFAPADGQNGKGGNGGDDRDGGDGGEDGATGSATSEGAVVAVLSRPVEQHRLSLNRIFREIDEKKRG